MEVETALSLTGEELVPPFLGVGTSWQHPSWRGHDIEAFPHGWHCQLQTQFGGNHGNTDQNKRAASSMAQGLAFRNLRDVYFHTDCVVWGPGGVAQVA
jgi:hypothetical protein